MSNAMAVQLEAEIKELESAMAPPEVVESVDNPEEIATPEAVEVINEEVEKPKRTNWKAKYQNEAKRAAGIKASNDKFKHETRQEITKLNSLLEEANSRPIAEIDTFKDIFSQEDADVVGDEAIEIMKKASKAATEESTATLKKEIAELKRVAEEAKIQDSKNAEDQKYDDFLTKLEAKVDNWEAINRDPPFINYLSKVDEDSGYTRQELLHRAEVNGDVGRIVGFMKDFEDKANPGKRKLEEKIGPTGNSCPTAPVVKDRPMILDGSYVDKYFNDVIKGKYKGNLVIAQEKQLEIDKALSEGRVDFSR